MTSSQAADREYTPVHWHQSLIYRVIILCVILLVCLVGSVAILTRHYFVLIGKEMENETQVMANNLVLQLEENKDRDLNDLEKELKHQYERFEEIEVRPYTDTGKLKTFTLEMDDQGRMTKVARLRVPLEGRQVLLTARVSWMPQTDLIKAFKNKYLLILTLVFVVTLVLMVYFIVRILRPLSLLSTSCTQAGKGDLQIVKTHESSGEVFALEQTFNQMIQSLKEKEIVEVNLRKAQRLSAIGNLAAGVAHDIRNPLNAIKLLTSHTMDNLSETDQASTQTRKHLQTIRDEVYRLEDIVSGFLSLAKERELQPEPCRIDALLDDAVNLIRKDAEARKLRLSAELRAGNTTLMIDPKQWTRAILNILINAMEACPEGGRVRLFSRITDQQCQIEIRDDGPGLSQEVAEHIFEPYFTTKTTGTGLGLSITRGIVEEHGGTIMISGDQGNGCQVLITLPLNHPVIESSVNKQ